MCTVGFHEERMLPEVILQRRATPSFSSDSVDEQDLATVICAGLECPRVARDFLMVQLQIADGTHIAEIVSVVNEAFQVEADFRSGERTSADEVAQMMRAGQFFVAIHDQRIAGVVFARADGATGYFGMLAVHPELQRCGIGRMLIKAVEDYCRSHGCTRMTLSTGGVRRELLDRYRRLGYTITSVEPASSEQPFTKPIEIVKMAKEI